MNPIIENSRKEFKELFGCEVEEWIPSDSITEEQNAFLSNAIINPDVSKYLTDTIENEDGKLIIQRLITLHNEVVNISELMSQTLNTTDNADVLKEQLNKIKKEQVEKLTELKSFMKIQFWLVYGACFELDKDEIKELKTDIRNYIDFFKEESKKNLNYGFLLCLCGGISAIQELEEIIFEYSEEKIFDEIPPEEIIEIKEIEKQFNEILDGE